MGTRSGGGDRELVRKKYDFRWEVLDGIIGGRSMVDINEGLTGFPMRTKDDADRFVRSYGYDLDDPIESAEVLGNLHEAIDFIRKNFLQPENPEGLKIEIPRKILEITDSRDLLLMAAMSYPGQTADTQGMNLRNWACSLLKVIHAIAHIDKDLRHTYFSEIQKQIFDRFYRVVHRDDNEKLYLAEKPDDPLRIELVAFETKPKKARESVLLKLLHKQESVADDIFDRAGVRFITHTPLDALRVVKYLKDTMVVMPANIKPSRSKNTLVEIEKFKDQINVLMERMDLGEISGNDLEDEVQKLVRPGAGVEGAENPHSSEFYRAIQFTTRQHIKLKNPLFEEVRQLKNSVKKLESTPEEIAKSVENLDLKFTQREIRFFYPYEVQIMDKESHEENERGQSAHSEYKKSQLQAAMKRVMGNLMNAAR